MLYGMEFYPAEMRDRFTVYRPHEAASAIWMHPGEPVFDHSFCDALLSRHGAEARRGAVFIDPYAKEPYLFHLAEVSVLRRRPAAEMPGLLLNGPGPSSAADPEVVENRLIGLRQGADGAIRLCPMEHLLLLHGAVGVAPGGVPLARLAPRLSEAASEWLRSDALAHMVEEHRARIASTLPERLDWIARGYDYKTAELIAARGRANEGSQRGNQRAAAELTLIREQQRHLAAEKEHRLAMVRAEPSLIIAGESAMIAHALVLPADDPEERKRHDAEVEAIAMQLAWAHEEATGATVHDRVPPSRSARAGARSYRAPRLRSAFDATRERPRTIGRARDRGQGPRHILGPSRSPRTNGPRPAICATGIGFMSCSTAPRLGRGWSRCKTRSVACWRR